MYHRQLSVFGAVILALCGQTALAASVSLIPVTPVIQPGATFAVDVVLDASDTDGPHPGNFCGEITVDFDADLLTLVNSSSFGTLNEFRQVAAEASAERNTVSFAFDNFTPDTGVVGTLIFQTSDAFSSATIGIKDGNALGSFANHASEAAAAARNPFSINEFTPEFSPATVQVVPVPAAAWLLLSALGSLGLFARKSRAAT